MIDALTKMDYMLGVMKRQREKLYQDCMNGDYDLMHGLREELPNVYRLSCERYRLMWIDAHWNVVHEFAEKRLSSEKDREALYLYFAKNFRPFIEPLNFSKENLSDFFFIMLRNEISGIEDMLNISNKHRHSMNELMNLQEIHWRKFEKKIAALSKERKNVEDE
ncbi:MAG TPA: hypothetical protein DCO72_07520 [Ruminococcus sp.]|nr:hypothetical protein [Ruminococcus sp.]